MTIAHRTRQSSNSLVHSEDRVSGHNDIDDPSEVNVAVEEIRLRGCADLPPEINSEQDRPLIEPEGKWHWTDVKGRTPASVLTVLLKRNHPGLIEYGGKVVVASTWKHYQAAMDIAGKSAADVVSEGFWKRFRFNPAKENESRKHVGSFCSQLLYSIMYYARITATMDHFWIVEKRKICDKVAGKFYLTREEYIAQRTEWLLERCWEALATKWSSPEFKQKSETNRANRYSQKFKPHKGGSNSIATIRQKLSKKLGREVSDIEAWVHSHRGSNPEDISSLNTEEASSCLEKYKLKAVELNGPDFDWLHSPVDARALYRCSCGRPHGKWALFNGVINDNEALPELRSSHANAAAARRQRQEEEEHLRKEAHDGCAAKEYAKSMFEWGAMVHAYNENIQKFMEQVASHTGMPATAVPSPPAPPPPPPPYVASSSLNLSLDNQNTQRTLTESMKLLAIGLVLLSFIQSFATSDYQVTALYEMRMQLNDDGGVLKDWKDNQMAPCNWPYVTCQDNKVIAITLSSAGLVGILSPSIAKITTLQQLLLDGNSISGRIPEELGNLSSLITLNLGRNSFNGSIPNSLGRLLKLQNLDLSENTLTGTIPISLSNLSSLNNMDLSENTLEGTIPISLSNLSSLNNINLSDNNFSGEIPEQLLQVAQYNYTGNHLNCSRQSTPCEKRIAKTGSKTKSNVWILVVVSSLLGVTLCIIFCFGPIVFRSLSKDTGKQRVRDRSNVIVHRDVELVLGTKGNNPDFTFFNYSQVLDATNGFSVENKLGQGGFGPVYKGRLPDGLEIAVKRLASHSMQGFIEFRNEVQLIAKLQHRNLVRLLGYCSHGEEKMLVYEYLKNKSLDFFIFDEKRRTLLNWDKRLVIIEGIAQGLLYLHKHSRLRVIHRDVKASNILLDYEMNPRISDFGMAKMFSSNDNEGNTERVVGTYGYMAPEYASEGLFSAKSDVFSFGVLILEIITGERNSGFYYHGNFLNLLGYAWQLWKEQRWPELVDISLATNGCTLKMMRCVNIALLCVQENAIDRPTTSDVVAMLGSENMALPEPKHPGYFHARVAKEEASTIAETYSINDATMSSTHGR